MQRLNRVADIVYWPYLLGSPHDDLARIEAIDVRFFAGAVRTADERRMAEQLRAKSRVMVALGACAGFGGMPGLANLVKETGPLPSADPSADTTAELPAVEPQVSGLTQVVTVDYVVPGCPPTQSLVWSALQGVLGEGGAQAHLAYAAGRLPKKIAQAMASGVQPPRGTVFAGEKAVCASCSRVKEQKRFESVKRPYQAYESTGRCLLEQGLASAPGSPPAKAAAACARGWGSPAAAASASPRPCTTPAPKWSPPSAPPSRPKSPRKSTPSSTSFWTWPGPFTATRCRRSVRC
ncbi:MAG: hypothetical protein MZV70_05220 [Desulfobacterales bacterium]|nr:hypothetical protein [Desulfobacterales bacterium]